MLEPSKRLIADLHLHSRYSRATSRELELSQVCRFGLMKGIGLIGTADWTHPAWLSHLEANLKEVSQGIYQFKHQQKLDATNDDRTVYFVNSTELSVIYKQDNRQRRLHHVVLSPSLEVCRKVSQTLRRSGYNVTSDGRPILGMSSLNLLEFLLEIDNKIMLIPAHIWTPWYSLYGARSGFDSLNQCFGKLSEYITVVETGLSSDPPMNWQVEELKDRLLVSFSDAHSASKLGREATVFSKKSTQAPGFDYNDLINALQNRSGNLELAYTIEFFPEEGKYHWSGHRSCEVCYSPDDIKKYGSTCPKCSTAFTMGVAWRTSELASIDPVEIDQKKYSDSPIFITNRKNRRQRFISLVPLLEILTELEGSPTKAKRIYDNLVNIYPEFSWLIDLSIDKIIAKQGKELAQAISRVRDRQVIIEPGYDGVFGKVSVLNQTIQQPRLL